MKQIIAKRIQYRGEEVNINYKVIQTFYLSFHLYLSEFIKDKNCPRSYVGPIIVLSQYYFNVSKL